MDQFSLSQGHFICSYLSRLGPLLCLQKVPVESLASTAEKILGWMGVLRPWKGAAQSWWTLLA